MATVILAGTQTGIHLVEEGRTIDVGGPVNALHAGTRLLAVIGDHDVLSSTDGSAWEAVGSVGGQKIRCALEIPDGALLGTSEAGLYSLTAAGAERMAAFDSVEGRDGWYTPWGGPPDTRSLAASGDETVYANVHVGGIPKTDDGGATWTPTIDVDADVHQVIVSGGLVLAACAPGLATSEDAGETWRIEAGGLHGRYCRAVATDGEVLFVSASTGPFTKQGAVYRRPLRSSGDFERCAGGLPEWFGSNIDSHCLVADPRRVAIGTDEGDVWVSADQGGSWELAAKGLAAVSCLAL